ncbi:hypothetical protein, partial [Gilvimarinus sp. 1_MG-2023]
VFDCTDNRLENGYLFLLLQTSRYRDHLDLHAHGTANQASLNISDMLSFTATIPPLKEQVSITEEVNKKLDSLAVLLSKSQE